MDTVAERVARGAALLDATTPGWVDKVELVGLDMSHPCRCVLGWAFGSGDPVRDEQAVREGFFVGTMTLESDDLDLGLGSEWVTEHGFDHDDDDVTYRALTAEWTRVIEARRGKV